MSINYNSGGMRIHACLLVPKIIVTVGSLVYEQKISNCAWYIGEVEKSKRI